MTFSKANHSKKSLEALDRQRNENIPKHPKPSISVVLVCYNQAAYLEEAMASIQRQSYQDIEVIAVDDASSDGSLEVLRSFERDGILNMRVFGAPNGKNRGIVATYTRGISEARGDYIAFLEADDAWSPNYLSEKIKVLEQFPEVGVVFSPCRILRSGSFGMDMLIRQKIVQFLLPKNRPFDNFRWLLWKNNVANFSSFVTRTELVQTVQKPNDLRLCFYDWWLLAHLSMRKKFFFETHSYTLWRFSRTSFMGRQSFQAHKDKLTNFLDALYKSLEANLESDKEDLRSVLTQQYRGVRPFMEFYRQASFYRWFIFFSKAPIWALETLVSYLVNRFKFS